MKIKCLYLKNFRNYKLVELCFSTKINYLIGKNAIGKTTVLEAISILSTGRSFKTSQLVECIKFQEKFFLLELIFEEHGINQTVSFYLDDKGKKISHNLMKLKSLVELISIFPTIVLAPEDLNIINDAPKYRRHFINLHLAKIHPGYLYHLSRYTKSLKQRNALLKTKNHNGSALSAWEEQMAISSVKLIKTRSLACHNLEEEMNTTHHIFNESFLIKYKTQPGNFQELSDLELQEQIQKELFNTRAKDFSYGFTHFGPHKDDIIIYLNKKNIASFASEGQKKCCLSTLKLAEWSLIYKHLNKTAVICIDDVKTSLDKERLLKLINHSQDLGQIIFTSPYLDNAHHLSSVTILDIEQILKNNSY